jgi:hypothetical protein
LSRPRRGASVSGFSVGSSLSASGSLGFRRMTDERKAKEKGRQAAIDKVRYWDDSDQETTANAVIDIYEATLLEASGWQPISTAPKDGTWILLRDDEPRGRRYREQMERAVCVAFWDPLRVVVDNDGKMVHGAWRCAQWGGGWKAIWPNPLEWMPIPE